jgi:hypothetical protein
VGLSREHQIVSTHNHRLALVTMVSLAWLGGGCDCNSSTPVQPDTGGTACPSACATGTYCCKKSLTCESEQKSCSNVQSCASGQELTYPAPPYMDENTCQPIPLQCACKTIETLQPGVVGRFSALAASKGTLMASAYEASFGDLVLATVKVDALDAAPTLEIVDGVPNTAPTKPTTLWRGGVEDPGDDVGQDTSIVVSSSGDPMISYYDATHRSLKLAVRASGKWQSHTVELPKGDKDVVGRYTALMLVGGKPAIAYLATGIPAATTGGFTSELRWALAGSATPGATADWTVSAIESKAMSCQNLCASGSVCVLNTDGSSVCKTKGTGCSATCNTDEACVAGACTKILAESTVADLPMASGLWPAVTSTSAGPVVVYYDRIAGRLAGAVSSGTTWKKKVLAGAGSDDVGAFPAVACDGGGIVHVTFQDAAHLTLHYLQLDAANLTANSSEVVDDGVRTDGQHSVGADSALLLDPSGLPRVVYQDQTKSDLLAAKRSGPGQWTPKTASDADLGRSIKGGPKAYGFYSGLAVDGAAVYGSTFYYDAQASTKGGLSFFKLP